MERALLKTYIANFKKGHGTLDGIMTAIDKYCESQNSGKPLVSGSIAEFRSIVEERRNLAEEIRKGYLGLNDPELDKLGTLKVEMYNEILSLTDNHFR